MNLVDVDLSTSTERNHCENAITKMNDVDNDSGEDDCLPDVARKGVILQNVFLPLCPTDLTHSPAHLHLGQALFDHD